VWNLNQTDLSEIIYSSVIQSNFPVSEKRRWIGENFDQGAVESTDINKTNLSKIRITYRTEIY